MGDAWRNWDDSAQSCPPEIHEGPALFLFVQSLLSLVLAGGWALLIWISEPRLLSLGIGSSWALTVRLGGGLLLLFPALLLWGLAAGCPFPAKITRALEQWVALTWGLGEVLARLLGISRDRLGHSLVRVANQLSLCSHRARPGDGLLVLAPRCLRPEIMRQLKGLAAEAGARFVVATGGEEARAAVYQDKRAAVFAVACERDLVEGIRDVLPRRTVLGLANRRPDGPCRNSEIDLEEARQLLEALKRMTRT